MQIQVEQVNNTLPVAARGTETLPAKLAILSSLRNIPFYYIDTNETPGFLLLLKNHIFTARSEDTIFIFHV